MDINIDANAARGLRAAAGALPMGRASARGPAFDAAILAAEHEASPDGILVVDALGEIISFNHKFIEMWRIPENLVATRIDHDVLDAVISRVVDETIFSARIAHLYRNPDEYSVDVILLKDGRTFQRYTSPMAVDDRYVGRVWFFQDITAFKQAEQTIREDETRFRAMVDQELAGVFILSTEGNILHVNPHFCAMLGYASEDVIGHSVADFMIGDGAANVLDRIRGVMSGAEESPQVLASLLRKDGTMIPFLGHGARIIYEGKPAAIWVALDVSELKQAQNSLLRLNRVLKTLSAGNMALVRATTEDDLLHNMCKAVIDVGGYRLCWIGFAERDKGKTVRPVAWSGTDGAYIESLAINWDGDARGQGPTGAAIRNGVPEIVQNIATDPAMAPWRKEALARGIGSSIALPLLDGSRTFGSLTIHAAEPDAFDPDEVKLLVELAGDLSYGVISLRARTAQEESAERLRRSLQATVLAIANTLEQRDPYTAGHQREVARLAVAMAGEMGVPEDEVEGIYLAGVVHDIGKIQVPAEILAKPGKLSKLEYQIVQAHAQAGYDIIKGVEFPWPVASMIQQHHERMDGAGYPLGLKADQILLGAKIIAVADVVQAMTAHRPYRAALGLDAALAEIEAGRGSHFYPPAVDACIALFRLKGFTLKESAAS